MPTYQTTFQSTGLMTVRNRFGETMSEAIDRTMDEESSDEDWVGEVIYIELVKVRD